MPVGNPEHLVTDAHHKWYKGNMIEDPNVRSRVDACNEDHKRVDNRVEEDGSQHHKEQEHMTN